MSEIYRFIRQAIYAFVFSISFYTNAALVVPTPPKIPQSEFIVNQNIPVTVAMPNDPAAIEVQLRTRFGNGELSPLFIRIPHGTSKTVTVTHNVAGQYMLFTRTCNTVECSAYSAGTAFTVKPSYTVTSTAGTGGSIIPASQSVAAGSQALLRLTPATYYQIAQVQGCGGTLAGFNYTTAAVTTNCAVTASFTPAPLVVPAPPQPAVTTVAADQNFNVTVQRTNDANALEIQVRSLEPDGNVKVLAYIPNNFTGNKTVSLRLSKVGVNKLHTSTCNTVRCSEHGAFIPITVTGSTSFTVTSTAGSGGSIIPASQSVAAGSQALLRLTPATYYQIAQVQGCGGTLAGFNYTTAAVTTNCAVTASFTPAPLVVPAPPQPAVTTVTANQNFNVTVQRTNDVNALEIQIRSLEPDGNVQVLAYIPNNFTGNKTVSLRLSKVGLNKLHTSTCNTVRCSDLSSFVPITVSNTATYTVSTTATAGGSINPASATVPQGQTASFSIIPLQGYSVSSVTGCNGNFSNGVFTTSAIYANCNVAASFTTTGTTQQTIYLHSDVLGSVIAESDSNGNLKNSTEYKPFGESKQN